MSAGLRQLVFDWFAGQEADGAPERKDAGHGGGLSPVSGELPLAEFTHPRANREVRFEHARVAYEFRRGKRRTIGLTVNADGLVVSAPRLVSMLEVEAALREKERWIVAKLGEARERQRRMEAMQIEWRPGASFPFLGQQVQLVLDPRQRHGPGGAVLADVESPAFGRVESVEPTPSVDGQASRFLHLGLPQTATDVQIRDTTQAWLMRQARRIFTARLDHFAPQLEVRWKKMSLSSAGTRWGSASADGSIRLNWRLVHFSEHIIDYVVVHELAHLREMNHGPRFWAHVESVLPDYASRRGELKDEAVPRW